MPMALGIRYYSYCMQKMQFSILCHHHHCDIYNPKNQEVKIIFFIAVFPELFGQNTLLAHFLPLQQTKHPPLIFLVKSIFIAFLLLRFSTEMRIFIIFHVRNTKTSRVALKSQLKILKIEQKIN